MSEGVKHDGEKPRYDLLPMRIVIVESPYAGDVARIMAGFAFHDAASAHVVYTDLGISRGMQRAINAATAAGRLVEMRALGDGWEYVLAARSGSWVGWGA